MSNQFNPSQTLLDLHEALDALRERDEPHCSFCGKNQSEVTMLVPGPDNLCICNLCVARAARLINARSS